MIKQSTNKNFSPKTFAIAVILVVVILGLGAMVYIITNNDRSSDDAVTDSRGQAIDMSPATEQDNKMIEEKKADGTLNQAPQQPSNISVSISRATQAPDKTLQIRVLVAGATQGQCKLTLSQGATVITKDAAVVSRGNYYSCEGFDVLKDDFTAGDWRAKVTVTNGGEQSSAEQTITLSE